AVGVQKRLQLRFVAEQEEVSLRIADVCERNAFDDDLGRAVAAHRIQRQSKCGRAHNSPRDITDRSSGAEPIRASCASPERSVRIAYACPKSYATALEATTSRPS